ncbi:hypothetical protein HN446_04605 [bacterium]|jgi:hypothetical protein|nr:hypothetical protein [bacterium]
MISKKFITLILNDNQKIKILVSNKKKPILWSDRGYIIFEEKDRKLRIYSNKFIGCALDDFLRILISAENRRLGLHKSINQDIGYLYNQFGENRGEFATIEGSWIGLMYSVFDTENTKTWIYNEKNKIVIEVTPAYEWYLLEPEDRAEYPDFVEYDEFIKDYKPILKTYIDKSTANEWIKIIKKAQKDIIIEGQYFSISETPKE